ncbi:MAG: carboxynorspermidine decarboxylase, partial [Elusimicrobia bacterium]|nr:carboxynorspermidine decarboxylase [Elusimicrobiota bacterium]
ENDEYENFSTLLDRLANEYGSLLKKLEWVSLGGGHYFTKENYPIEKFAKKLKEFSDAFDVQIYLEPGEAAITNSASLVVKVLDIIENDAAIAIVDSSVEAHMLDLLIYQIDAKMEDASQGKYEYTIAGKSCLAGDIFGRFRFREPLRVGSLLRFTDAAGYTMVKKNWFNGLQMPSIVVKRLNGNFELTRSFDYNDFKNNLS